MQRFHPGSILINSIAFQLYKTFRLTKKVNICETVMHWKVSSIGSEGRPPSGKRLLGTVAHRPDSGKSRILGRPLYRKSPQTTNTQDTDLTWADLTHYSSGSSTIKQKSSNDASSILKKFLRNNIIHILKDVLGVLSQKKLNIIILFLGISWFIESEERRSL